MAFGKSTIIGVAVAALLAALLEAPANACEGHTYVRATLDPLPRNLDGVHVAVYKTVAQQIAIENRSQHTIEVLDEGGRAFIRIGPRGVEGNLAVPAWHLGVSAAAVVSAKADAAAVAQWRHVDDGLVATWFDVRLDATHVRLPSEVMLAGKAVDVGRWEIPLRVDGQVVRVTGAFRYDPPAGSYQTRLTSPREIAPGVQVTLLPGPSPGLMLRNSTGSVVVVYGEQGEPFLRVGPKGTEANVNSSTWRRSARSSHAETAASSLKTSVQWVKVGASSRFSWIEPRAAQPQDAAMGPRAWRVPVRIGDQANEVTGIGAWQSF